MPKKRQPKKPATGDYDAELAEALAEVAANAAQRPPTNTKTDWVARADELVGAVIRHALDEIAVSEPDKGKWLIGLLRKNLSRPEFRTIRVAWQLPPRWPTVRRRRTEIDALLEDDIPF